MLNVSGLKPLNTDGLKEVGGLNVDGLKPLDVSGLREVKQSRFPALPASELDRIPGDIYEDAQGRILEWTEDQGLQHARYESLYPQQKQAPLPESDQGRLRSAAGSFVQGLGQLPSSILKAQGLSDAPSADVWKAIEQMDMDSNAIPLLKDPTYRDTLERYRTGTDFERAEIKGQLEDQVRGAMKSRAYQAGEDVDNWFRENFETNPKYADEFWSSKVPQALGSATSFLLSGLLTRGAASGATPAIQSAAPALMMGGLGSAANKVEVFEDAINSGASIGKAVQASQLAELVGTTEAIPLSNMMERLDSGTGGALTQYIKRALREGTEEAVQESFVEIMNASIAKGLYDPERGIWTDETLEAGGAGFVTGVILETLMTLAIPGKRPKGRARDENQAATEPSAQELSTDGLLKVPEGAIPAAELLGDVEQQPAQPQQPAWQAVVRQQNENMKGATAQVKQSEFLQSLDQKYPDGQTEEAATPNLGTAVQQPADVPVPQASAVEAAPIAQPAQAATDLPQPQGVGQSPSAQQNDPVNDEETVLGTEEGVRQEVKVPVADLKLSKDVPNFKSGANEQGVVQPLGGTFDDTGVGPLIVWQRKNGDLEVVSGRHRLDLAKRSGTKDVRVQIFREEDGYNREWATTIDAELNIRDENGEVRDYANYFRTRGESRASAEAKGLLSRAKGRDGFDIAESATDLLYESLQAEEISERAAAEISRKAPKNEALQAMAMQQLKAGKGLNTALGMIEAVQAMQAAGQIKQSDQGDLFGMDDSAMQEAERMAKEANKIRNQIKNQIAAAKGAAKNPAAAKKLGVDVKDPEAVRKKLAELDALAKRWEKWPTDRELREQLAGQREQQSSIADQAAAGVSAETVTATQDTDATETVQPALILMASGKPFSTFQLANVAAQQKQKFEGLGDYRVIGYKTGFAIQPQETAVEAAPQAENQPAAPTQQQAEPTPDLVYSASNKPFQTRKAAELSAKNRKGSFDVVEVDGGFALKPVASNQAEVTATAEADTAIAVEETAPASKAQTPKADPYFPAAGLPILDAHTKPGGYQRVAPYVAEEAYRAVNRDDLMSGVPFYLYVKAPTEGAHGIARLVPDGKQAPDGWQLVESEPYRLGWITKEQAVTKATNALRNQPIIGESAPATNKVTKPKADSKPKQQSLAGRRGNVTDAEINAASEQVLRASLTEIANDFYRGLNNVQKTVAKKARDGKPLDIDEARQAVKQHRDYWVKREEEGAQADADRAKRMEARYGNLSIEELEAELAKIRANITGLQKAGEREMTGNGGRRTGAATANEAARAAGQEALDLESYIRERKQKAEIQSAEATAMETKPKQQAVRTLNEYGEVTDGVGIKPGDVFRTATGRTTTPYPKQKSEKYASQWLIDNAVAEAESRGNDFAARNFRSASILKSGELTTADRESMNLYLFGKDSDQPDLGANKPKQLLKPLVNEQDTADAPTLDLTTQTEAELAEADAKRKAEEAKRKEEERKQKIRDQADDFALTDPGMNQAQAELEAGGQTNMFDLPEADAKPKKDLTGDALADIDLDSLADMIDAELRGPEVAETHKPAKKRKASQPGKATKPTRSKRESKPKPEFTKSAAASLESAGVKLSAGGLEGLKGLAELFTPKNTLNSGLIFTEESYQRAKPHFQKMWADFQSAGKDLRDFIRAILDLFGSGAKPFIMRFAADYQAEMRGEKQPESRQDQIAKADKVPVKIADADNIRKTLPTLLPEQQDDVVFVEQRFQKPDGHGALITNGTGTGKTYSGLGVVKRYQRQGKKNILIITPSEAINSAWLRSAPDVGVEMRALIDTKDAGEGTVITTYANFYQNMELVTREWDLIVADEAHHLRRKDDLEPTKREKMLGALTFHPRFAFDRHSFIHADEYARVDKLQKSISSNNSIMNLDDTTDQQIVALTAENAKMNNELLALKRTLGEAWKVEKEQTEKQWSENRTQTLMLSATPFAYVKSVDMAQGYLFEYPQVGQSGAYNAPSAQDAFFMTEFGFRKRYGKLTQPEAGVDRALMERQFNEKLKKAGVVRGRALEVEQDYDRKYVVTPESDGITAGAQYDAAMDWLEAKREELSEDRESPEYVAYDLINTLFNQEREYLEMAYMLEGMKAEAAIPYIKKHLEMGRKVVVFHDYNKGGSNDPLNIKSAKAAAEGLLKDAGKNEKFSRLGTEYDTKAFRDAWEAFSKENKRIFDRDAFFYPSPQTLFKQNFEDAMFFNGTVPAKQKLEAIRAFNEDGNGKNLLIAQLDAMQEGVSVHDTSGEHQRVLIYIGLMNKPTAAIQIEGRIYRVGLKSDALFRYMTTGLTLEDYLVSRSATRAGTAENLGMGEQARGLEESFRLAYESASYVEPSPSEGKGGKALDRRLAKVITPFEIAKTRYFGAEKVTGRRDQREGEDFYPTPDPVGLKMVEWAALQANEKALEPSAGAGAILQWFPERVTSQFVEPFTSLNTKAKLKNPKAEHRPGSFEELDIHNKYDAIIMNPPFGQAGAKAFRHVTKAMRHLNDGGRVVALVPMSEKAYGKFLEDLPENMFIRADIKMPASTFEKAGTKVMTRVLIIDRSDVKGAAYPTQQVSFTGSQTISELFDRLENADINIPRADKKPEAEAPKVEGLAALDTKHGRTGEPLYVVEIGARLDEKAYNELSQKAKAAGGFPIKASFRKYYKGAKGIPAFDFRGDKEARDRFISESSVDTPRFSLKRLPATSEEVSRFSKQLEKELGLKSIHLFLTRKNDLKLQTIIVDKQSRGAGVGTEAMQRIVEFADQNGFRIALTPAVQDDYQGTTSRSRLVKFYKRFGFVENKGRNKDYEISEGMYREPIGQRFKRGMSSIGMTQSAAQSVVDEVTKGWKNAPKVNVVQSVDQLPDPIYDYADSVGALGDVRAVYWRGEMYFVADRFGSRTALEQAILHEGIGHFGVRSLFGDAIVPYLQRVYLAMGASPQAKAIKAQYFGKERPFDANNKAHRVEVAEELLAHLAESGKHRNLWNKIVSFVRDALRAMRFKLQINEKDLLAILRAAEAVVKDGGISRVDGAPAMSRVESDVEADFKATEKTYGGKQAWQKAKDEGRTQLDYRQWVQVRTPAFKNWFGDWENGNERSGKTVSGSTEAGAAIGKGVEPSAEADAGTAGATGRAWRLDRDTGEPRVFYHGTADKFTAFDLNHRNKKDKGWLGRGVYTTSDSRLAKRYAKMKARLGGEQRVIALYANVRNPYVASHKFKQSLRFASQEYIDKITAELQARGHDGVVLEFKDGTLELVAFNPADVKSATGNTGEFSDTDDIRFSRVDDPRLKRLKKSDKDKLEDPSEKGALAARQELANRWYGTQPLDQALRLPFHLFGGIDERGQWNWGKNLSESAERIITTAKFSPDSRFSWINPAMEKARMGLLDHYGLDPNYVERERQRGLQERELMEQVPEIMQRLSEAGVGAAEAKVLQAVLTGEEVGSDEMAKLAAPIRKAIDDMGAEAVQLGLLSAESYQRNRGAYLHRVYEKHEADKGSLSKWVSNIANQRRRKIIGNQFKGRGMWIQVGARQLMARAKGFESAERGQPVNGERFRVLDLVQYAGQEQIEGIDQKKGGKVLDRVYLPENAPIPTELSQYADKGLWEIRGKKNGEFVLWRDFTKDERLKMGEIVDARYTIAKTYMQMAHDLSTGRFFKDIAQNADWATSSEPAPGTWREASEYKRFNPQLDVEWVKVPNTEIPKSKTKRYGALAGMYVRSEIWRDLRELEVMQTPTFWNQLLTQWKLNKTARSPVVHMNNVMSNAILMDLADVRAVDLVRGIRSMLSQDKNYKEAVNNGAFGSDMVAVEIRRNVLQPILEQMQRELQGNKDSLQLRFGFVGKLADSLLSGIKAADRKMVNLYQLEDEVFRMATYMRKRSLGLSPTEAALEARDQFLNYDIRAPWVNAARRSVLPFISYTYRAIPVVAKSIALRPWKLAKYATVAYLANALAYSLTDGDEDEERRSIRDQEQGRTWIGAPKMMRMPWEDDYGNPVFLDIRRWIPAGDIFDMNQGQSALPVPAWLQFGGPIQLAFEFTLNKQAFTGKEIVNDKTDDIWDKASKVSDWAWKSWMPSAAYIPGSWYWERIGNAAIGARDWQGRPYQLEQAIPSSIGIKLKPHDVDQGFMWKGIEFDRVETDLKREMRTLYKDKERGLITPREFEKQKAKILDKVAKLNENRAKTFNPR